MSSCQNLFSTSETIIHRISKICRMSLKSPKLMKRLYLTFKRLKISLNWEEIGKFSGIKAAAGRQMKSNTILGTILTCGNFPRKRFLLKKPNLAGKLQHKQHCLQVKSSKFHAFGLFAMFAASAMWVELAYFLPASAYLPARLPKISP